MIPELRQRFNDKFSTAKYDALLRLLETRSATRIEFRIAETPVFLPRELLDQMADAGEALALRLLSDSAYLQAARRAIPKGFCVAGETVHPNFLTADFALVRNREGDLSPRLVEIQAFPSVFGYQEMLSSAYRESYDLPNPLGSFLGGLDEEGYWTLLRQAIVAGHDPENVVLTEVDPLHQKTLPDFRITAQRLGIAVVDIATLEPIGDTLHYRNDQGLLTPIRRIYNRAIADELIVRKNSNCPST